MSKAESGGTVPVVPATQGATQEPPAPGRVVLVGSTKLSPSKVESAWPGRKMHVRTVDPLALEAGMRELAEAHVVQVAPPSVLSRYSIVSRVRHCAPSATLILVADDKDEFSGAIGYEMGADACIQGRASEPFLLANILAALRQQDRWRSGDALAGELRAGELRLARNRLEARFKGRALDLPPSHFEMLWTLAGRCGGVVSRDHLAEALGPGSAIRGSRFVDCAVSRLRSRLAGLDSRLDVRSVRLQGYRLVVPAASS